MVLRYSSFEKTSTESTTVKEMQSILIDNFIPRMEKISFVYKDNFIARLGVQYSALQMLNVRYRSRRLRQSGLALVFQLKNYTCPMLGKALQADDNSI